MAITNSEWDDIPTSSELFGGDFFGDELMEMYTADHGLNLGDNSTSIVSTSTAPLGVAVAEEDKSHPGVLVAMNAAAMDGGLSPLGSSPEFVPMTPSSSGAELPPYPAVVAPRPKAAPAVVAAPPPPPPTSAAPVPAPVTSAPVTATPISVAKRPVAAVATAAQGPSKKLKGGAPTAAPPIQAKLAATGGVKVGVPPAPVGRSAPAPRPIVRTIPSSIVPQPIKTSAAAPASAVGLRAPAAPVPRKVSVPAAPQVKAVVPKAVGAGINHQVTARPMAVPSSVTATSHRIMPPAPPLTASTKIAGIIGGKKPDVPPTSCAIANRAKSEADFKDVASAAVSSLIQNATGTLTKTGPKPIITAKPGIKTVDTSTAHINALTSQNWVTACNPIPTPDTSSSAASASACDKAARNARRATLTQEERAKQNRDRNREHARNTRLRKKAYVEELKRTLTELVAQRDAGDLEKRHEAQRNREQREVRFRVMEEFLKLRGRNELNVARWVAILEDGFTFTLPRTSFRRMVDSDKSSSEVNGASSRASSVDQVLRGAAVVMEDSQHLSTYLQSIGGPASTNQVQIVYRCDRKRFFMDGNIAFMDFGASTLGAVLKGGPSEVSFKGSVRASFSPASNKLISIDIVFDTGAFVQQVESMGDASTDAAAAVAAHEADALLDSLQMPQIFVDKKEAAAAVVAGPVSVSSDDGEQSTDGTALLSA
ncbi:hypothetical protein ACHAXR_008643 [Thalassiosira sp. AJA248-18]